MLVGNLLNNPAADSFITLEDAVAYLEIENHATGSAYYSWLNADEDVQTGTLVRASRWLASAMPWTRRNLSPADMVAVGRVVVRLAALSLDVDLFKADTPSKEKKRVKAEGVEVEFATGLTAHAAGQRWPWLYPSLYGLIDEGRRARTGLGVFVV